MPNACSSTAFSGCSLSNLRYALWAEGIGKTFGEKQVLKSASVWAEPGKITTLMGRNGSGKTTLLKIAAGAMRPDHGVISFGGVVKERRSLARMARSGLMYVPQEQLVVPSYRVRDHFRAIGARFGTEPIERAISEGRVETLLDRRVGTLSGGERVRVSFAVALARRPTVLLADEPLVGLAPKDQEELGAILGRVAASGVAVVTSGHDVRALLDISDTVIWSVAGTTHHMGTPDEAVDHEQFRREYLGPAFHIS